MILLSYMNKWKMIRSCKNVRAGDNCIHEGLFIDDVDVDKK